MGKQKTQKLSPSSDDILNTLGDFTSKENWDKFFTIRGSDDAFEWYAEWDQLRDLLVPLLQELSSSSPSLQILVPGCGNSSLSEHVYDAGFQSITNIDFSKVVISNMLRRNVRDRPHMRWRVMDMTQMQIVDETFDVVLDKGGLDALMEPEQGSKLGNDYLCEVNRVLKPGGKFICLTLAESHVLGLVFSKFRFGWNISIHAISQKSSIKPKLQTFMVDAEKTGSSVLHQITSSFNYSSLQCGQDQILGLREALSKENQVRKEYSDGSDLLYSLEDLQLRAKGDLRKLTPGRRVRLTLGGQGTSCYTYRAILLDAKEISDPFSYNYGVFIVPKARADEWLFSSEEGQWQIVESSKSARLLMVLLDIIHLKATMEDIQKDLSPLVKQLAPAGNDIDSQIPFMMAGDGIKQRSTVSEVTSRFTGPIIVEDVVYENVDSSISCLVPSEDLIFRRLIFKRTEGLVQSEALLTRDGSPNKIVAKVENTVGLSKSKKRATQRKNKESHGQMIVNHGYLASSYHTGIISGLALISSHLECVASSGNQVKAVIIGLGAGLLPMFLHESIPCLQTEVVELDPTVLNLARDYFGFTKDKRMEVHIGDGVQFVKEYRNLFSVASMSGYRNENEDAPHNDSSDGSCFASNAGSRESKTIDILIVDVDSADSSSGMTCPAADFVEGLFLSNVKGALSEKGLFIINLVTRSPAVKDLVVSRMKMVFGQLYCLQLEEDVNLVIFGVCSAGEEECIIPQGLVQLDKLLKLKHPEMSQSIRDAAKKIQCLK